MRKKKKAILEFVEGFDYKGNIEKHTPGDPEIRARLFTASEFLLKMLKLQFKSFWWMQLLSIYVALWVIFAIGYDCLVADQDWTTYLNILTLGLILHNINTGHKRYIKRKAHVNHLYFILTHVSVKHKDHPEQCDLVKLLLIAKAALECKAY